MTKIEIPLIVVVIGFPQCSQKRGIILKLAKLKVRLDGMCKAETLDTDRAPLSTAFLRNSFHKYLLLLLLVLVLSVSAKLSPVSIFLLIINNSQLIVWHTLYSSQTKTFCVTQFTSLYNAFLNQFRLLSDEHPGWQRPSHLIKGNVSDALHRMMTHSSAPWSPFVPFPTCFFCPQSPDQYFHIVANWACGQESGCCSAVFSLLAWTQLEPAADWSGFRGKESLLPSKPLSHRCWRYWCWC